MSMTYHYFYFYCKGFYFQYYLPEYFCRLLVIFQIRFFSKSICFLFQYHLRETFDLSLKKLFQCSLRLHCNFLGYNLKRSLFKTTTRIRIRFRFQIQIQILDLDFRLIVNYFGSKIVVKHNQFALNRLKTLYLRISYIIFAYSIKKN